MTFLPLHLPSPLAMRQTLGRLDWGPPEAFGLGWRFRHRRGEGTVIITESDESTRLIDNEHVWIHASMSRHHALPSYEDAYVLHLWGRADGVAVLPNFGALGTI